MKVIHLSEKYEKVLVIGLEFVYICGQEVHGGSHYVTYKVRRKNNIPVLGD